MDNHSALRTTLAANAAFSLIGGAFAAIAPERLDRVLDTGYTGWVRLVGIGLMVFAAGVFALSRSSDRWLESGALIVSAADATWVFASLTTILAGWFSASGAVVVAIVAAVVAMFGTVQLRLAQSRRILATP